MGMVVSSECSDGMPPGFPIVITKSAVVFWNPDRIRGSPVYELTTQTGYGSPRAYRKKTMSRFSASFAERIAQAVVTRNCSLHSIGRLWK
jgi:hypothetical protein